MDFHREDWFRDARIGHDIVTVCFHCPQVNCVEVSWEDYQVFIVITNEAWHVTQYYLNTCEASMWTKGCPAYVDVTMIEDIVANLFNSTTFSGEVMNFEYDY